MTSRRLVPLLAVAVVLLLPATPAGAGGAAVRPDNAPTPLAGTENGEVPERRLITAAPGCRVERGAGPSLALLFRLAQRSGVDLTGRDCYRPLSGQVAVSQQWTAAGNSACAAAPTTGPGGQVQGTSNHGWGKAVDFGDPGPMGFGTRGYAFLKAQAAVLGWNHPAWAEPGGSPCPEAWHWEWVGDGGIAGGDPVPADTVALVPGAGDAGYSVVTGLGAVRPSADGRSYGAADATPLEWVVVGAAATPDRGGYWLVAGDGGVFTYGDATYEGSTGAMRLNEPIVGMAPTPTGQGYWLVAADGGIFSFGDAVFHGSTGAMRLNSPVVGMAPTPTGQGYWLVAADGGIFSFGDAVFHGSTGDLRLNSPVAGMSAGPDGNGYWLVGSDGGVFAFGTATFVGSATSRFRTPVVGIVATLAGDGYWVVSADGAVAKL
jgi:hypothetical protein